MESFKYILDATSKKFVCPDCGKKRFVRYRENQTGNYLNDDHGRCDRQTNCGYHKAPPKGKRCYLITFLGLKDISNKAYKLTDTNGLIEIVPKSQVFELTLNECWISEWYLKQSKICYLGNDTKYFTDGNEIIVNTAKNVKVINKPPSYHSLDLQDSFIKKYEDQEHDDNLTSFLLKRFSFDEVQKATRDYYLTGTNHYWNNATVFWQIDEKERIHSGKIMHYDSDTGKRIKEPRNRINWVHNAIKAPDFTLNQCLYGLQLINTDYHKTIAIAESEKTAIIMSIFLPDFIWLATGGKENLKPDLFRPLKQRDVVLFPDKGEFLDWKTKADEMQKSGFRISTSELIEKTEHEKGIDLADLYLL